MFRCSKVRCVRKLCVSKYPVNWPPSTAQYTLTEAKADVVWFEQTKSSVSRHRLKRLTLCHAIFPDRVNEAHSWIFKHLQLLQLWRNTRIQSRVKSLKFPPFANCFVCPQTGGRVMSCYVESALANIRDDFLVIFAEKLPGQVRNCNKKRAILSFEIFWQRIEQ